MKKIHLLGIISLMLLYACATNKLQIKGNQSEINLNQEIAHSFYLIGDAGNAEESNAQQTLNALKTELERANKKATLLFLGDNIYPMGMPEETAENRTGAENKLNQQIQITQNFKGQTIFIPGNHDWYSNGVKGLKREQEYIESKLGKKSFLPKNGKPIETIDINENIVLIIVDSEWYITNWDKQPSINEDGDIKTKAQFLDEFRGEIKKAKGKTTLVAIHHPMFSSGPHGGQYSFVSHLTPFPILGSIKNFVRKTSGISNADMQNKDYNELKRNLVAAAQQNDKVIFISGHEHSLQYIKEGHLPQIISGSGSKNTATKNIKGGKFSYSANGFAILDVYQDGSSSVRFKTVKDDKIVYQTEVLGPDIKKQNAVVQNQFPLKVTSAIYEEKETNKSAFYKFLWGNRYRKYYSTPIIANTVDLDTLFGGLTPVRKGGGTQSKALRLVNKEGKQYVIRAMRKNGSQYIQAAMFKDQYVGEQFNNTASEAFIMDVFTGSYPYASLVTPVLSDAIGLHHLNPKLYYIPKQKALGNFNDEFGDELYILEENAADGHTELGGVNATGKIISTADVLKEIQSDASKIIDEKAYIKARLFDLLIGDWDRHQDQWRWIEFNENGKTVYRPLPRDRDQAFSVMSDGFVLGLAVKALPTAALLRKYSTDLTDVKGFNIEPYPLDVAFIRNSNKDVWDSQVKLMQNNINDEVIEKAFGEIPAEMNDEMISKIKQTLKARKDNLQKIADRYFSVVSKYQSITASNKDDVIKIDALENGNITLSISRNKKSAIEEPYIYKTFAPNLTKEIWIYGLDDKDVFHVTGKSKKIKIRLIGGQNNDTYQVENGKNIKIYDYQSKSNDITKAQKASIRLQDDYDINVYDYKKPKNNTNQFMPSIGSNPDDGTKIEFSNTYTLYGFNRNPSSAKHQFNAAFYYATKGYEFAYKSELANVIGKFNLELAANFQSPNFSLNFYGYGNDTKSVNNSDDLNYYRVKISDLSFSPSLVWKNKSGNNLSFGLSYQSKKVEETKNRFIENNTEIPDDVFDNNQFIGVQTKYQFENADDKSFPTNGIKTGLELGYKTNIDKKNHGYFYLKSEVSFVHQLFASERLVLATQIKSHILSNNNFEFYQAAAIGGTNGLRGFRNQRFTGQQSFFQNTDIRYTFNKLKTNLVPIRIGFYGGFDYGRVWVKNHSSTKWNNSYGGGVFVNVAGALTTNLGLFKSSDGSILSFTFGFQF